MVNSIKVDNLQIHQLFFFRYQLNIFLCRQCVFACGHLRAGTDPDSSPQLNLNDFYMEITFILYDITKSYHFPLAEFKVV